ncbi:ExeM/NucH family extracellular endonuclease [Dokdonella sp.]|uniref:ExeM/NucH family extracellular endonuclease n=1 Tax=Dokdonella sp. TaxID=2291710 RepID=UPI001B20420E|nr:ExeM/NucH family extracellular endonuclease [Dokdonella sp.]MBO9661606.1 ExeM/NucH family extracellular endonuclease [Dokdonella sp.]
MNLFSPPRSPWSRAIAWRTPVRVLALSVLALASTPAFAQVSLTALDVAYTQNFNTLPASGNATWTNNSTLPGWFHARTGSGTTIVADTGASNSGNLYSYGTAGDSDRALGSVGSSNAAAGNFFWGVRLQNHTGGTITSLDVAYTGEQWRNSAAAAQTVAFSYLIGTPTVTGSLADFQAAGTAIAALDFTSPVTGGTAGALNGNLAANRLARVATISDLDIPDGAEILLRWSDPDQSGADHGLSIDDFSVTPHGSAAQPSISIDDVSHLEGNSGTTAFAFTVTLSEPAPAGGVTFDIATADATATAPSDYAARSLTAQTIPAGATSYTFEVQVNGDTTPEPDEQFSVNLFNVVGATVSVGTGIGTIQNDDGGLMLSIDDVSHDELNSGSSTYTFTVSLSAPAPTGGVTFDIATADDSATAPSDYIAKSLTGQTIAAGTSTYTFDVTVNGDTTPEPDERFFVRVTNVVGALVADGEGVGTIVNDDVPDGERIHDVQGNGATSPMVGANVSVEGVVTASYQGTGGLSGFFLQEEDADADADPATSEGIFVFCGACPVAVAEGQRVRASGTVSEYFGMTQITASTPTAVLVTEAGNHLSEVTPTPITLPISGNLDAFYEAREGMLVTYTDTLLVSEFFQLARFGQIILYPGSQPYQFTETNAPSTAGYTAHLDTLARKRVILDDTNNVDNWPLTLPEGSQYVYHPHANGGFSAGTQGADFFRSGDKVQSLTGVLHWSFAGASGTDAWRIRPTLARPATFTAANPRPTTAPTVGGAIKVASANVLNYFTTIDTTASTSSGSCGPSGTMDCRGADSAAELVRQRERTSIALCGLNADVIALMEIENDPAQNAINDLVTAVNARCANGHAYTRVDTGGSIGTDAIRVAMIYRTGVVAPFGSARIDTNSIHDRPPLAQTFDVVDTANPAVGQRFTAIANHLKSKRCTDASGADVDTGDGQSCYAARRTQQVNRLVSWINSTVIPAAGGDADVLLLGDFNSNAKETPITTLASSGYDDLVSSHGAPGEYSYLFDGQLGHIDYALASTSLASQVTGAATWHINADEVPLFDYNDDIKDVGEATFDEEPDGSALTPPRSLWIPNSPYRASDHNPVLIGLFPAAGGTSDVAITVVDAPDPATAGGQLVYTVTVANSGSAAATTAAWTNPLPSGTRFVSLSAAAGWSCTTPAVGAAGTVDCSIASFASGSAQFTLTVSIAPDLANGTTLQSVFNTSAANDPNTANNSALATTTINTRADLSLTMTDTPDPVVAGSNLSYAITLTNAGPSVAAAATLSDTLPADTTFVSLAPAAGWSCTTPAVGAAGTVSCSNATFAPGNAAFTLVVKVDSHVAGGAQLTNTATAGSSTNDPSTANNSATATTQVQAAPQGQLTVTPNAVDFGSQTVGSSSTLRTITLGNSGNAALDVTSLTEATAPFARNGGSCGMSMPITLAPGASCDLAYVFTPSATGPASQSFTLGTNAASSGAFTLSGTGVAAEADIEVSITDAREYAQVGDTLNTVIEVKHVGGTATATVNVHDALPAELGDGSWTCAPTGTATCAGGNGDTLSDSATLPPGTRAIYTYSATVQGGAGEVIVQSASATVGGGVVDPNPANNSATDTPATIIVIFRDGFDDAAATQPLAGDGAGFVSAQLQVEAALLDRLGAMPVEVARGETTDGTSAFAIELARFGTQHALRLTLRDAQGRPQRGEWRTVDLAAAPLDLAWQSATPAAADGYVRLAAGSASLQATERSDASRLVRLRIREVDGAPWLSLLPN